MIEETKWMQKILPDHYTCVSKENGVHCHSRKGIDDNDKEHWFYIFEAIKQKFGDRFIELYHQTCTNHQKFTVYLRPL